MKYSGWPEPSELVVGKVDEIEDFGVFVDLEEYEGKRGLCHISEVASGWIKNVRDHVNTGQTVVAKVLDVDESAQQIDLSIKDDNWMELAFGEGIDDETYGDIANALLSEFGSLYDGFEAAAIHGESALDDTDLEDEENEAIVETARSNVSVPYVNVTGYVDLECPDSDGVDVIKEALQAAEGNGEVPEEIQLEVTYVGSPEYRIQVQAPDYKTAESELEASADRARSVVEAEGGTAQFHRDRTEDDE